MTSQAASTKARPILFSAEMVRAIRAGHKCQTRRVLHPQPPAGYRLLGWIRPSGWNDKDAGTLIWQHDDIPLNIRARCPYGRPGDQLWVRETWATVRSYDHLSPAAIPMGSAGRWPTVWYVANPGYAWLRSREDYPFVGKTRPSIFMPRWASRITLTITHLRAERLQDITAADAYAEGIAADTADPVAAYANLWDRINKSRGYGWETNPWVFVIGFTVDGELCP